MGNSSIRIRHSYSGSGWSVRTIGAENTEPKNESRRLRPFAWVLGGAIIVSILGGGGVAILSQRAPQPDRSESRLFSREEFGLSSPAIQTEATGSIEEPIVVSPIPAPVAPVEPNAPAPLLPVPQPVQEAVHPPPAVPPISRAAESAGAHSGGAIEREVQPAHVTGGQVARIVLTFGSERGAHRDSISSPIVVGPGGEKRVVLYTELRGLAGETISHRWERDGQTMAVVPFQVGGDRWRVHSSKRLTPALRGSWKVAVTDAHGAVLASRSFLVR